MLNINLLPWRMQRDLKRKKQFISVLGVSAAIGVLVAGVIFSYVQSTLTYHENRNLFLKDKIRVLDGKIKKIEDLDKQREMITNRISVIQNLQGKRSIIVHVFDGIVRTLPEGVYLVSLIMQGHKISVIGMAESNHRISEFLRNLDHSIWFSNPDLSSVRAIKDANLGEKASQFHLSFLQVLPANKENSL